MTKLPLFTVYDSKADAYTAPFTATNTHAALRDFAYMVNEKDNLGRKTTHLGRNPADYTLFEIGEWNVVTGELTLLQAKKSLAVGIEVENNA